MRTSDVQVSKSTKPTVTAFLVSDSEAGGFKRVLRSLTRLGSRSLDCHESNHHQCYNCTAVALSMILTVALGVFSFELAHKSLKSTPFLKKKSTFYSSTRSPSVKARYTKLRMRMFHDPRYLTAPIPLPVTAPGRSKQLKQVRVHVNPTTSTAVRRPTQPACRELFPQVVSANGKQSAGESPVKLKGSQVKPSRETCQSLTFLTSKTTNQSFTALASKTGSEASPLKSTHLVLDQFEEAARNMKKFAQSLGEAETRNAVNETHRDMTLFVDWFSEAMTFPTLQSQQGADGLALMDTVAEEPSAHVPAASFNPNPLDIDLPGHGAHARANVPSENINDNISRMIYELKRFVLSHFVADLLLLTRIVSNCSQRAIINIHLFDHILYISTIVLPQYFISPMSVKSCKFRRVYISASILASFFVIQISKSV
eukprot:g17997.t1